MSLIYDHIETMKFDRKSYMLPTQAPERLRTCPLTTALLWFCRSGNKAISFKGEDRKRCNFFQFCKKFKYP